ncbi:histidine kinase dimerization/phospho-acceptor domain-containing protein [Maricaulis sp.]|uniref:histidine kinase dimerization/phospho-acceptor domain-containing protein n=1 Tax=Maricaulis sp. TaxID=1486257 RepID=UPI003A8FA7A1
MSENFMLSTAAQDVFVILALALTLFVIARNLRAISFAGVSRELGLISIGMLLWGGFHLFHLAFLLLGPLWASEAMMLQWGSLLQTYIRWGVETVATVFFLAGVVRLTLRFGRLMAELDKSASALAQEHRARTTLEAELKTASATRQQAGRQESEFLLGLSHELRTPLNGIIGLGSLLGNTSLDANQRRLLGTLEQSAQTMLARVGAVIELSQLRTGDVEVRAVSFSPAELVRSIIALYAPSAKESGLTLVGEASEASETTMVGDSRLTRQMLSILTSLAIKYSPVGTVTLAVDLDPGAEDIVGVTFTVVASELEFPAEVIERVRSDQGSMRGDGGIGLATCWQLAGLMEGNLAIASDSTSGTTIRATLPMRHEV